jgi:hypothetical protein
MKLFIDLLELFVWIYILYFTIRKVLFTFIGGKVRYTRYLSQSAENYKPTQTNLFLGRCCPRKTVCPPGNSFYLTLKGSKQLL